MENQPKRDVQRELMQKKNGGQIWDLQYKNGENVMESYLEKLKNI